MKKTVLVVDLDGTLFSINTFHHFIRFLITTSLKKGKLSLLVKLLFVLFLRLIKAITHARLKYQILKLISPLEIDYELFVNSISENRNNIGILKDFFDIRILATAAPYCYAKIISKNEGFTHCIGSELPKKFYESFENIKENKRDNVINYLKKQNLNQVDVFITDHEDDLPLMKLSNRNVIVSPGNKTIKCLNASNISYEILG